jgi:hypothetical protein
MAAAALAGVPPGNYWQTYVGYPGKFFFTIPPGVRLTATTDIGPFFTLYQPPAPPTPPPQPTIVVPNITVVVPQQEPAVSLSFGWIGLIGGHHR